jgi:hypothetical protein
MYRNKRHFGEDLKVSVALLCKVTAHLHTSSCCHWHAVTQEVIAVRAQRLFDCCLINRTQCGDEKMAGSTTCCQQPWSKILSIEDRRFILANLSRKQ